MNTLQELWKTLVRIHQVLGFSSKIRLWFYRKKNKDFRVNGNVVKSPTQEQIDRSYNYTINRMKMNDLSIFDLTKHFKSSYEKRDESIIDSIVIGSTDSKVWGAKDIESMDTSEDNPVTPGKELPGIGCHVFIKSSGSIEITSDFDNIIYHTPGQNTRSIYIMIDYPIGNSQLKSITMQALVAIIVVLCMRYKLDPTRAVKLQNKVLTRFLPFIRARRENNFLHRSPGYMISKPEIVNNAMFLLQKKLQSINLYDGDFTLCMTRAIKKGILNFDSEAMTYLYKNRRD